jgi:putative oxidoreductase
MTDEVDLALLILRVTLGLTMAAHGANKFRGGLAGVGSWFESIGMRPGRMHAWFAAGGEVLAGLLLAAGFLTSFAAMGFVGLMTVAAVTVHLDQGFFIIDEGWEYVFVLAVTAVAIAMLGPGEWSIDHALGIAQDLDGFVGLAISAGGGLLSAGLLLAIFYRRPTPSDP